MAAISLTAQMTTNLLSLQNTSKLLGMTQERLATGKKVNSAIDDPVAFFDADAHYQLASDYGTFKNGMSEAIQTIKAATDTIESVKNILQQMKSVATSAKSATTSAEVTDLTSQYNELMAQLDTLADDAIYKGVNLLQSDTLNVVFNTNDDNLAVAGFNAHASGLGLAGVSLGNWFNTAAAAQSAVATVVGASGTIITPGSPAVAAQDGGANASAINAALSLIDAAVDTLRSKAKSLATNLGIVTTRQDFTDKMIATLKIGGDNLTLADMNEEGANMLMLQTRQALGIQSLSIASQSAQQVLQLFG